MPDQKARDKAAHNGKNKRDKRRDKVLKVGIGNRRPPAKKDKP